MWIDDDILRRCAEPLALACFIPKEPVVVMGSGNVATEEVELERCAASGIAVLRRYGGGGTVLLHDGCVVVSAGLWVKQAFQNKLYFFRLNQAIIDCLAARWPVLARLDQRGLSDIVFGDLKVAGTSLFRSRNYLLYQASVLVDPQASFVARHLKHPTKEPDYRKGRPHGSFMTGLAEIVATDVMTVLDHLREGLASHIEASLGDEMSQPVAAQFAALQARVARSEAGESSGR